MVTLEVKAFTELERKLVRNKITYWLFCIIIDTGVIVQYPSFTTSQAIGFNSRLYTDLTKHIDKEYNVIIEYVDNAKGRKWHMIVPTQKPLEFEQAIRIEYELQRGTMDVNKTGEDT